MTLVASLMFYAYRDSEPRILEKWWVGSNEFPKKELVGIPLTLEYIFIFSQKHTHPMSRL